MLRLTTIGSSVLSLLLTITTLAMAMPSMPSLSVPAGGQVAGQDRDAKLIATVEYPRSAPWLAGQKQPLPPGNSITMQVPMADKKSARLPLAMVDGQPLTVADFRQALQPVEVAEGEVATVAAQDPSKLLQRLVDTRVIVREAQEIGLHQLPEVRNLVEIFRRQTLRDALLQKQVAGVKEDATKVEQLYRELIRESKIRAVLFDQEQHAKEFTAALKTGGKFETLAGKAVEGKKAELKNDADYVRHQDIAPEMAAAIGKLKAGEVSPVIRAGEKFAVIQLLASRSPENPHAREDARQRARNFAQNRTLADFSKSLTKKYVKLDRKLFESIDFSKNVETLLKDKRVIADVRGGEAVTVADLAEAIKGRYYHGLQRAIDQGKIKEDRFITLNEILAKRTYLVEALAQGLDRSEQVRLKVQEYEDSIVFGAFLQKAVVPELTLALDELKAHYRKNIQEYTTPEMLGLAAMVFVDAKHAQAAMDKLKKGTDFQWLAANAAGQVTKGTSGLLEFSDNLLTARSLPAGLQKTLGKVETGQVRLYDDGKGHHYVLSVKKVVPATVQPFEEVQATVLKTVYDQKLQSALKDWSRKLRDSYPVQVFVKNFNQSTL